MSAREFALWRAEFLLNPWDPQYAKSEGERAETDFDKLRRLSGDST